MNAIDVKRIEHRIEAESFHPSPPFSYAENDVTVLLNL